METEMLLYHWLHKVLSFCNENIILTKILSLAVAAIIILSYQNDIYISV